MDFFFLQMNKCHLVDLSLTKMSKLRKVIPWVLNRYTIAAIAFVVYLLFFDTYSLMRQQKLRTEERELMQKRDFYLNEIEADRKAKEELMSNAENLEKYAREQYMMKRENEDVFVVIEEDQD